MNLTLPQIDPMPLPGPLWLLRCLLLLTFALHLLFMNALFGGSIVAFACALRRARSAFAAQLCLELRHLLPVIFAFTVTLGVAPLLFVQVLYGHLLYTSSILMAFPWLGIIGMVLLAYYGLYYFSLKLGKNSAALPILGIGIILLAGIAFTYSNNFTLMLAPERWLQLYRHSAGGWNLNWAEPTLLPRYLHFVLAALAITGLLLVVMALRKREQPYGRWLMEQGALLFLGATVLNFLVGFWWLATLDGPARMVFMGRNALATVALLLGVVLAMAAVVHLVLAKGAKAGHRQARAAVIAGVLIVPPMVVMRDAVRNAYLAPHFQLAQLRVAPQWGVILLFAGLFVIGLVVVAYMLHMVARASRGQSAPASETTSSVGS